MTGMIINLYQEPPAFSWRNGYVTYRRFLLDTALNSVSPEMKGVVIDLGGKRNNKRGIFQPPEYQADLWLYVNLDIETCPDLFADVTKTPLMDRVAGCIICTEVLEHLSSPQDCVDEMHRLLHDGGLVFASVPFLYPVHADPHDYQRFTEDGLRHLFRNFNTVEIHRMGGYVGVLGLLIEIGVNGIQGNSPKSKLLRWSMKWISRWLCRFDVAAFTVENDHWQKFTTGYFILARR